MLNPVIIFVVIPGSYFKDFKGGGFNVPCALVNGKRTENSNKKTSVNDVLRDNEVAV